MASAPYRERDPRQLPEDTEPIGAPPRTLPRRLRLALMFDQRYWYAAIFALAYVVILPWHVPAPRVVALAATAGMEITVAWMLQRRLRLVRLLERGVVAPVAIVTRKELRFSSTELTRMRVLPGWRRKVESYEGPLLRVTMRVGLPGGPTRGIVRNGGEWGDDLCLFDPAEPRHHVLLEELQPFVGVRPQGGWAFIDATYAPHGTIFEIASGIAGIAFAVVLGVLATVVVLALGGA